MAANANHAAGVAWFAVRAGVGDGHERVADGRRREREEAGRRVAEQQKKRGKQLPSGRKAG
jgi:hypothetical protein